jgi:hypothetical protein
MPLQRRYSKRGSYYTRDRKPGKKTERRLLTEQPVVRPLRFQIRSIVKYEYVHPTSPWWFIIHRRGPSQKQIGEDPLEARATPKGVIRGTLPERIIYRALVEQYHMVPDVDFLYQSSLQGGRLDTGGIVADFLFPYLRIVINPTGPTHNETLRIYKDKEQVMALAEMGYTVYFIEENKVYDEAYFNNWMRQVLGGISVMDSQNDEVDNDIYAYRQVSILLEEYSSLLRSQ